MSKTPKSLPARGRGRPSKPADERLELVQARFPLQMIEEIDAACDARLDKPGRSAMIRELVALGLKHLGRSR
jgi:hypothetical protein